MKSFLTRLGSGILLVAIILVTGAYGSWPLWIAVTLPVLWDCMNFTGQWIFRKMICSGGWV